MNAGAEIEAAIARWCAEPFSWGTSDCLTALADVIQALRGYDFAHHFRGRYRTKIGALRVTHSHGGILGALQEAAAERDWLEIDPKGARTGDLGVVLKPAFTAALRCGRHWVCRTEHGAASVASERIERAWRVR